MKVRISPGATRSTYINTTAISVIVTALPAVCSSSLAQLRRNCCDCRNLLTSRMLQKASITSGRTMATTKYAQVYAAPSTKLPATVLKLNANTVCWLPFGPKLQLCESILYSKKYTHTRTHTVLMAIFQINTGHQVPVDFQPSVIVILNILTGQAKTFHDPFDTLPSSLPRTLYSKKRGRLNKKHRTKMTPALMRVSPLTPPRVVQSTSGGTFSKTPSG